ncbi:porin [Frigidibacter sp. RF13]|uniref:porin n=1 Tax=Frigidibacter sp. RF13 TaxID=2997340 RepID=UPI00227097A3|nr:porin [Frigidibacter sp. RF13]MCY1128378.1 porin [Frigidibacter sp. RF13]
MKKILLATTALAGFAGAAAAEVSLSGYAEIGVFGGDAVDTQFHSDLDVTFTLSGESDSGLSFGASIDLDEVGDDANATGGDPISHTGRGSGTEEHAVWVSGSFGKVTLGDTDGALDWAVSEIYSGSAINDDHSTHAGAYWNTGLDGTYDGQVMRYEYSFGDFGVAISAELDDTGTGDAVLGLGFKWSGDMGGTAVSAGIGHQSNGTVDVTAVSLGATLAGGFSANLGFADGDLTATGSGAVAESWWGLGVAYTSGALTVGANYGTFDLGAAGDQSGWGLVVNYDLGGGAVAQVGYGDGDAASSNGSGDQTWSAGLALSF